MAYKGWEAIYEAAKALNSDICAMSWNGFNLLGDERSIAELRRLMSLADRLHWFEETYRREHPAPAEGRPFPAVKT